MESTTRNAHRFVSVLATAPIYSLSHSAGRSVVRPSVRSSGESIRAVVGFRESHSIHSTKAAESNQTWMSRWIGARRRLRRTNRREPVCLLVDRFRESRSSFARSLVRMLIYSSLKLSYSLSLFRSLSEPAVALLLESGNLQATLFA